MQCSWGWYCVSVVWWSLEAHVPCCRLERHTAEAGVGVYIDAEEIVFRAFRVRELDAVLV